MAKVVECHSASDEGLPAGKEGKLSQGHVEQGCSHLKLLL